MTSNFETMKELIAAMSGNGENTLAVNKMYLEFMGSLEGGVFLSQLIYFSDKSKRTDGFFYKSYSDWEKHTYLSEYNIRKQVKKLVEMGVLETKIKKAHGNPTLHYKFDMDAFIPLFSRFLKNRRNEDENFDGGTEIFKERNLKKEDSLTKTTTENTTKIIDDDEKAQAPQNATVNNEYINNMIRNPIFAELMSFYEQNVNVVVPAGARDAFNEFVDDYGHMDIKLVKRILQNTMMMPNVKHKINYAFKTLRALSADSVHTIEQHDLYERANSHYEQQPTRKGANQYAKRNGATSGQTDDFSHDNFSL